MSSRMRVTKGHRNNRRSHHGIKAPRLSLCSNCGAYHQRHRVCLECGYYKGVKILDIVKVKKAEDKAELKAETKAKKTETKTSKKTTSKKGDDLTKIEGVGPKTAEALNNAGIKTFADLADSKVGDLRKILEEGNLSKYDPKTWSKQARLARDEKWDELKKLQEELDGGEVK